MKVDWEDDHIMYDEEERTNIICNFFGVILILSVLFFTGYGIVSFIQDVL